jgi:hypothetical protein
MPTTNKTCRGLAVIHIHDRIATGRQKGASRIKIARYALL